jgi:hypothetical protein
MVRVRGTIDSGNSAFAARPPCAGERELRRMQGAIRIECRNAR